MNRRVLVLLASFVLSSLNALAAEIRVLTANPTHEGIARLAEQFKRDSGHDVKVQAGGTPDLTKLLAAGGAADVFIGPAAMVDQALKEGKASGSKSTVGRVGVGVAVRKGASMPNLATADALKQAVLSADAVVYNTAGSGQYMERLFEKMGVAAQIQGKSVRPTNAAQTMDRMLQGKGMEIGFGLMSEMKPYEAKGLQLTPLPSEIQNYTSYEAVVLSDAKAAEAAKEFLRYITTPAAKKVLATTGVE